MSDVYISCVEEDADFVRRAANTLRADGWNVWCNPSLAAIGDGEADLHLNGAGAVLVVWSANSRSADHLRSEAATGMYRNKLVQVRLDASAPPRPFDQADTFDLQSWNGDHADPNWQRLLQTLALFAGAPGVARPQVVRGAGAAPARSAPQPTAQPTAQTDERFAPLSQKRREPEPRYQPPEPPRAASRTAPPEAVVQRFPSRDPGRIPGSGSEPPPRRAAEPIFPEAFRREPDSRLEPQPDPRLETRREARREAPREAPREATVERLRPKSAPEPVPEPVIARVAEPEPAPAPTPAPTPAPAKSRTAFADLDRRPDARLDSLLGEEHRLRESPRSDDVEPVDDLFATSSRRAGGGSSYDGGKYRSGGSGAGPWLWLGGVALLGALAAAFWVFDPLGMTHRTIAGDGGEAELAENAAPVPVEPLGPAEEAVATGVWTTTDRDDPEALRGFLRTYPGSANADTARSLLRVMDAQAWANAVASDTESAYETYLATFPAGAPEPGAMTTAAKDRLASLGKERSRAVTDIQNGLKLAGLFDGAANGKVTDETRAAASAFARRSGVKAPDLASAAPRDLRAFGDAVRAAAEKSAGASTAAADTPVAAPAEAPAATPDVSAEAPVETSTASVAQPETTAPTAADAPLSLLPGAAPLTADEAADLERQAQAAAAAAAAQLQQENAAWLEAQRANTMAAYRAFIAQNPASAHVEDARGAIRRLGRSPAYGVDRMPETVRTAVTSARQAQSNATARAAAARTAAERAETVAAGPAASEITAPDGDLYRTETANSAPNGFGTRVSGKSVSAGDRYEGQLRNGLAQGLGVYTYGDNPNNAQAGALRYEGEHAGDQASGLGVTYWKNGDRFAGETRVDGEGQGVMNMTGGQRYEGQLRNGLRHGYGVVWGADGQAIEAGRFENGVLVEPAKVDAD